MNVAATTSGKTSMGRMMVLVIVLLVAAVGAMFVYFGLGAKQDAQDKEFISRLGDQRVLSQTIAKQAAQAARGDLEVFSQLRRSRNEFADILNYQQQQTLADRTTRHALQALDETWTKYRKAVDAILERQQVVSSLRSYINGINEQIPALLSLSDEVVTSMAQQGADSNQVYIATRQLMLLQRISSNVSLVLAGGEGAVTAADRFGRDAALFGRVVQDMLQGNKRLGVAKITAATTRDKLLAVSKGFAGIREQVGAILERSGELFQVTGAAEQILAISEGLLARIAKLADAYEAATEGRTMPVMANVFAGISLALVAILGYLYWHEARRRLRDTEFQRARTEEANMRNQGAILRLLDEMGDLADGDLTVTASVTEDMTGAIADSVNYAIEALRSLVTAINNTTQQVSSAAQQTQATAIHLAEASEHQAQQITDASSAINEMAVSIEEVSSNAGELAEEAKRSVGIAGQGAEAVRKTIDGMDTIREQIQETSKRIKRLGESSQEIGDIVELINDIAEQTNILALNAAIQAAMAGEAGRGFAVVADEVQRLAERSGDATRQIEALVKGIQSDTKQAVNSMEESTAGVVAGAQLAQNAGEALQAIEDTSSHLASLIGNISNSASQQARVAINISEAMNVIQEITTQTSAGTNETAASIGDLAVLANELRHSVAGFKLPLN